jgi:hypothetical protein
LRRVERDSPDGKSHEDGFAVDRFLIAEVAARELMIDSSQLRGTETGAAIIFAARR